MDCISNREMGNNRGFQNMRLTSEYATRHMLSNAMMKECPVSQQHMNKVIHRYLFYVTFKTESFISVRFSAASGLATSR